MFERTPAQEHPGPAPWRWAASVRLPGIFLGALVVTAIFWALMLSILEEQKQEIIVRQVRYTSLLVSGLSETVARALFDAQAIARNVSRRIEVGNVATALGPLPDIVSEWYAGIGSIMVFDHSGTLSYATRDAPQTSPSQVKGWLDQAGNVERPATGKLEFDSERRSWFLPVIAPYVGRSGQGSGVVVVTISARSLLRPYSTPGGGVPVRVEVIGPDGVVWARLVGGQESGTGYDVSASQAFKLLMEKQTGSGIVRGPIDGVERLDSFAAVQGSRVWAVAGSPLSDVLEPWETMRRGYLAFGLAISALILALAAWGGHSFARERAHSRLLAKARDEAQSASRMKSEFVTAMSHELRTPLASIVGYSELLAEREFDTDTRRNFARSVLNSARHLSNVVNDILDISKIEAGKMQINLVETPLRALLDSCMEAHRNTATQKGLDLRLDIAPDLPDKIRTDSTRLTQILTNLLGNAVKFTERGFVALRVDKRGDVLEFAVADSGPGIAEQFQLSIFERFRQGDPALSIKHGGTGLGLPLVKYFAEMMGGTVRVKSAVGQGAVFTVTLPLEAHVPAEKIAA